MSDIAITFTIVAGIVVLFLSNKVPVVMVALATPLALYLTGVLGLGESLGGLGDPAVIFIASLFIISEGLDATGVTAWGGQALIRFSGKSKVRLMLMIMGMVALLTGLISVNGAVAALLPVVIVTAVRTGQLPSRLLMPLVFAAHAGSMLTLTGTPVNVLISEASNDAGYGSFGFFEFALAGIPLLLGAVTIILLFGKKLLPERTSQSLPSDLSRHAHTLVEQYRFWPGSVRMRVRGESPWIGSKADALDLSGFTDLKLVGKIRDGRPMETSAQELREGDLLVFDGCADALANLANVAGLSAVSDEEGANEALINRDTGIAEVVIPPRSPLIGQRMFPGMTTPSGDLIAVAIHRGNEQVPAGGVDLLAGDVLLLQGTWKALDRHLASPEVLVVDSPDLVRRQAVPLGAGAKAAIAILLVTVALLATGALPTSIVGLMGACAMVFARVLSVEQCYRAVNWTTVILVGAMMPLSTAMSNTGAAGLLADQLVSTLGAFGPIALIAGLFVLTAILGQLISNTATALIIIPIGIAVAVDMGVSPKPILMAISIAAAAAFLTPVATPVNLMVMGPAGYKFGDYWKLGLPLMAWFFIIAIFLVPLIWPL
jgi:di/tricarboxylate transporter